MDIAFAVAEHSPEEPAVTEADAAAATEEAKKKKKAEPPPAPPPAPERIPGSPGAPSKKDRVNLVPSRKG